MHTIIRTYIIIRYLSFFFNVSPLNAISLLSQNWVRIDKPDIFHNGCSYLWKGSAMKHFILLQVILVLIFNLTYGITISNLLQLAEKFCVFTGKLFYSVRKIINTIYNVYFSLACVFSIKGQIENLCWSTLRE